MFQVASIINSIRTLADGTARLTVDCQEMNPEQLTQLFALNKKLGFFLFKENPITEDETPNEVAPEYRGDKTPGQRLRAILYQFWKLNTNQSKPFNDFYIAWMDKKVNEIKEQLPEYDRT